MKKIAYITTSLGAITHTFIRREVRGLRSLGVRLSIFGIRPEISKELTDEDMKLVKETFYLYPLKPLAIIRANIWLILNKPSSYFRMFSISIFNKEKNILQRLKLVYHFFVSAHSAKKMQTEGVGHVHAHFTNVSATMAMYAAGLMGISYSITLHSAGTKDLPSVIDLYHKIKYAKFLFAVSNHTIDYYDRIFHCREKVFLVHCGIDPHIFKRSPDYKFPSKGAKVRLISIGRIETKKGFTYLVEACRYLAYEKVEFNAVIIGGGSLLQSLRQKVKEYDLSDRVLFKGSCSEDTVRYELERSDICIVPSTVAQTGEEEGIPTVIMEAMASGVPVIATAHSGIPEIVKDRETGLLIPEKDPPAIVKAIKILIDDEDLRKRCIENGRMIISEEFNIRKIAEIKKEIFEENI